MTNFKYRPEIDGLRAIAITMVLIYHAFPSFMPGGFIGVDVFFVISGYLITRIISDEIKNDSFKLSEFYRRRIDRIFPALLTVLISCLIFGWISLFADEYMQLGKLIAGSSSFTANIVLYSETGYFNTLSATKPLLHIWSLGVEEQFYIVFPLLMVFIFRSRLSAKASISFLIFISFSASLYVIEKNPDASFYLPQYRAWELLIGSILGTCDLDRLRTSLKNPLSDMICFSALICLAYVSFFMKADATFPGWNAVPPVIAAAALIAFMRKKSLFGSLMSCRPFVYIGFISYPLYLWHWPLLSFARVINGEDTSAAVRVVLVFSSFVLAVVTYSLIEKPLKRRASWKRKTTPLIVSMLAVFAFGVFAFNHNGIPSRQTVKASEAVSEQLNGALWQYLENENCNNKYHYKNRKGMPYWFCIMKYNRAPDVLLLGNSYANHLYPGMALNKKMENVNFLSLGTASVVEGKVNSYRKASRDHYAFMDDIINMESSIKYVIISGVEVSPDSKYISYLSNRIKMIHSLGKKVIVFYPHVKLKNNIKACFSRPFKKPSQDCVTDDTEAKDIYKKFNAVKLAILKNNPDTLFFNPNNVFCKDGKCSSVLNGMPIYRDDYKHFSVYASMKVGDAFSNWAQTNAPDLLR